jgi:uncharacterized protein (AIM24 family)
VEGGFVQVRTRHTPTFGVARLVLAAGEAAQASPAAMVASSYGIGVERAKQTAFRLLAKSWKDASVFTATGDGGWVDVAASLPGDLFAIEMDGSQGWSFGRDSWLAAASTIALDPSWPGFHDMFGGIVGFLAHAAGLGPLVLSCCGALDLVVLGPGELITVEAGHLVAYQDGVQCRLRAVSQSAQQSVRTGEGLVVDFAGPGQLITQSHSPRVLAATLAALAPQDR